MTVPSDLKKKIRKRKDKSSNLLSFGSNKKQKLRTKRWMWQIGIVVVVSVLVRLVLDYLEASKKASPVVSGPIKSFLSSFVCRKGFCHSSLTPVRRTHEARSFIKGGETLLVIPRELQIWDLDAMRNKFIQDELMFAKHPHTDNPLDSGAFLAAHLLHRFVLEPQEDDPMAKYYEILPLYQDLKIYFPTLWSDDELQRLLHKHSTTYSIVRGYRDMMMSEYHALTDVSAVFKTKVPQREYMRMRVLVMSRSFGTGPPTDAEAQSEKKLLSDELHHYRTYMGIDLKLGCRAMVPVLDMYNHHAKPNVEWSYDTNTRAFVVKSVAAGIPAKHEIYDSYGKYTDAHLYAKFGFQNGDGSGYTETSIASMHRILDVGMKQQFSYVPHDTAGRKKMMESQKYVLARYLQFDDGYSLCIRNETSTPKAWALKKLKLQHLMRIANTPERWTVRMPPRNNESLPATSSDKPITTKTPSFDPKTLEFDGSKALQLCRLIALTWEDYDGDAINFLNNSLQTTNQALEVEKQSDGLEYRALMCLIRLTGLTLHRLGKPDLEEEENYLTRLTGRAFGGPRWHAKQARLGELQTLDLLNKIATSGGHDYGMKLSEGNMTRLNYIQPIRKHPCDWNYTEAIANETDYI